MSNIMRRDEITGVWRNYIMRHFICTYVLLTRYYLGNEIEKNEMGGACNEYG